VLALPQRLRDRRTHDPGCAVLSLERAVLVLANDVRHVVARRLIAQHTALQVPLDHQSRWAAVAEEELGQGPALLEAQVVGQHHLGEVRRPLQTRADVLFDVEQQAPFEATHALDAVRLTLTHDGILLRRAVFD